MPSDNDNDTNAFLKVWNGLRVASDLIGSVRKLEGSVSKQQGEIVEIKVEQAAIAAKLEMAVRMIEAGVSGSTSSGT